jgi:hypothetical protein
MNDKLSFSDIESYDPQGIRTGDNWRFLCPLCGYDKPHDDTHRSLSFHQGSGLFNCKRCAAKGKVKERWEVLSPRAKRGATGAAAIFAAPSPPKRIEAPEIASKAGLNSIVESEVDWKSKLGTLHYLCRHDIDTFEPNAGGEYLLSRGLDLDICMLSDVRFSETLHKGAVVFPISDEFGKVVAVSSRQIRGDFKGANGPKKLGVFATLDGLDGERLTITEAALDALSLRVCGVPSISLNGKDGLPQWVLNAQKGKLIQIAFDADAAGDKAAESLTAILHQNGASVARLRPPQGFKDWNAVLMEAGKEELTGYLKPFADFPE